MSLTLRLQTPARALAVVLAASASPLIAGELLPAKDFARYSEFSLVRLSPTGEYLAAAVPRGKQTGIAVIRLSDMKATAGQMYEDTHVSEIWWVGPKRFVMGFSENAGPLDQPVRNGMLVAMDFDGSNMRELNPLNRRFHNRSIWLDLVATRTRQPNVVLLSSNSMYQTIESVVPTVYRIDTATGASEGVTGSPVRGLTYFVADQSGELRYAVGTDPKTLAQRTFIRDPENPHPVRQWSEFGKSAHERSVIPVGFSKDAQRAYLFARDGTDTVCLTRHELKSNAVTALACQDQADLADAFFSSDGDEPLAAVFETGVPEVRWLKPDHPDAKLLRSLGASFPGQFVEPVSWSEDGSKLVFLARSDRNPGEFFLYDRAAGSAKFLFARRQWIDPAKMAQVKPLTVKSRNAENVYAYLTLPPGKAPTQLPLVVMPHGGPIGIRDAWAWDADAQFLASRGYAVLQVNFHGSGGYGYKYQESGRQQWGSLMIDDITDAVRATIAAGTVDASRICAYGGSYGGYASLMGAVREPDLYQCVISYVGVYDLAKLKRDTNIGESRAGKTFMGMYIGDDATLLAEHSPINYLDKLRAPVFIVHGEDDARAPFNQAQLLREQLEKRKHPFEWLAKKGEGHGFYTLKNRVELYEKMADFLDRHIGERRPAAKPQ